MDVPFSAQSVDDGYWELFHDDDCGETLITSPSGYLNSWCPKCKFSPDMQSLGARRTKKELVAPNPPNQV